MTELSEVRSRLIFIPPALGGIFFRDRKRLKNREGYVRMFDGTSEEVVEGKIIEVASLAVSFVEANSGRWAEVIEYNSSCTGASPYPRIWNEKGR